jgi:hypothetical protein
VAAAAAAPPVPAPMAAAAAVAPAAPPEANASPPLPPTMLAAASSAPAPAPAPAPAATPQLAPNPDAPIAAVVTRSGDNLRVELPFVVATPAAVFRRADVLWMVFDSAAKIDVTALTVDSAQLIRSAEFVRGQDGEGIVRVRLERPLLASVDSDGPSWIVNIGDAAAVATRPLAVARSVVGKDRASITIPFADPRKVHDIGDRAFGDRIMVVTAMGPARGFIKSQDFVELRTLPSTHGVVVQPIADDISAELSVDKITISRPGGLSLSATALGSQNQVAPSFRAMTFDTQLWGFDRQAKFTERQSELIRLAASAPPTQRKAARLNLARFYLAQDMAAEAKAVLDVALADDRNPEDVTGSVLKAAPTRRSRTWPIRRSAPNRMPQSGAPSRSRVRAAGTKPAPALKISMPRSARCRFSCNVWRSRNRCVPRSRCAISPAPPAWSTSWRPSACRPNWRRRSRC